MRFFTPLRSVQNDSSATVSLWWILHLKRLQSRVRVRLRPVGWTGRLSVRLRILSV